MSTVTNLSLLQPYFESIGLPNSSGDDAALHPVAVFLLQDMMYSTFYEVIAKVPFRYRCAKIVGQWKDVNRHHFAHLFLHLDQERKDVLIDLMDDLSESISNEVSLVKFSIMDGLSEVDLERQKVLASVQLCNLLAQLSDMLWGYCFENEGHTHPYNQRVRRFSAELTRLIWTNDGHETHDIKKGAADKLAKLVDVLYRKIINWINDKSNETAA